MEIPRTPILTGTNLAMRDFLLSFDYIPTNGNTILSIFVSYYCSTQPMIKTFSILTLLFLGTQALAQNHTISGYIEDLSTGEKMIGATIYDQNSKKGTTTNAYGFFSLTLPEDSVQLRISYVGYQQINRLYYLNQDISENFTLTEGNELEEFEVVASEIEEIQEKSEMSTIDLDIEKVKSLPVLLGEQDIMKTIQLLPGVQSGSEGSSGLYVRGGGPDQNLILLDGVPVYNASHLFGFFSVFNADAINSVKLIKGGFPAHYGGRLSSVIDIKMKEGNNKEFHGEGSIGLISSKLLIEAPIVKDKTSFILSARRTYIDVLAAPLLKAANDGGAGGYYFYDVNAKVNHKFSDKSRLYLSAYQGKDRFYSTFEDEFVDDTTTYVDREKAELAWGNQIAAIRWNYLINPKLFSNTTLTYSKYQMNIGFEGFSSITTPTSSDSWTNSFVYTSGIQDFSGKIDFDYTPHPDHYVKFGTGYTHHNFTPGVNTYQEQNGGVTAIDTSFGSNPISAGELWGYVEDDFKLNDRIKANIGLHYSGFLVEDRYYNAIQPRFSGRYLVNEDVSIKASYSRMAQYLHLLTNTGIGLPTDLWVPPTDNIEPQFSHQVAIGAAKTHKKKYQVSVEAYYKTMENLIEYKDGASFFANSTDWQDKVEVGRGWSYGGEFLIEKRKGNTTGWVGYTLSWTNRQFDNLNNGEVFPYRYDRRHDIGIGITHKFNDRIDAGLVWVYGTGNAVTLGTQTYQPLGNFFPTSNPSWIQSVTHIESRNNYRMPSYHRLDLGVNIHKKMKWGERTWSFGLYNAYSRQNPFYLFFSQDAFGDTQLTQISLFPVIPSFSYQFKF